MIAGLVVAAALALPPEMTVEMMNMKRDLDEFIASDAAAAMLSEKDRDMVVSLAKGLGKFHVGMTFDELVAIGEELSVFSDFGDGDDEQSIADVPCPKDVVRGDLVFRRESGGGSRIFAEASTVERRFSHVGIVVQAAAGTVRIMDVSERKRFEAVAWDKFFENAQDGAVYRFAGDAAVGERIANVAEKRIGVPFDASFSLAARDSLYCTRMVRECVNEAVGRALVGTTKKNGFEYVAVDDCYRNGMRKVHDFRPAVKAGDAVHDEKQGGR